MMGCRFSITWVVIICALMIVSLRSIRAARTLPSPTSDETRRTPVLVELFTSEGCSRLPATHGSSKTRKFL